MKNKSAKSYRCPACRKETEKQDNRFFPFCCERCKLIDLGAWLDGKYIFPDMGVPPEDEGG